MTLIGFCSAKGSPGVTTSALAIAAVWPRSVLLAECDPAGGDVVAGFLRAQTPPGTTLLDVALASRRGLTPDDVLACCLPLGPGDEVALLAGLTDPAQVASTLPAWRELAVAFQGLDTGEAARDVLVDCGRLDARGTPVELLARCDLVVLVLRPRLAQVHQARHHLAVLRGSLAVQGMEPALALLLVGDRPYTPREVSRALGLPVLAVLPVDDRAAVVLSDGTESGRWFDQSALIRGARQAAVSLRGAAIRGAQDPHRVAATAAAGADGAGS